MSRAQINYYTLAETFSLKNRERYYFPEGKK
jgi:hypothetical protein